MPPVARMTRRGVEDDEAAGLAPVAEGAGDLAVLVLEQVGDRALHEDVDAELRPRAAAACGSSPGRCGRRRGRAGRTCGRRSRAGRSARRRCGRTARPSPRAPCTRSGASWACSWAIRQLLSIFPPRMVSRKCTSQLSSGQRLPMAAAMPPSAITVCALPSSDLQTTAGARTGLVGGDRGPQTGAAGADHDDVVRVALHAALRRRRTSRCRSSGAGRHRVLSSHPSEEPRVVDRAGRQQVDVEVDQGDGEQGVPGVPGVLGVELRDPGPQLVADRVLGEVPQPAADDVPAGVARRACRAR